MFEYHKFLHNLVPKLADDNTTSASRDQFYVDSVTSEVIEINSEERYKVSIYYLVCP